MYDSVSSIQMLIPASSSLTEKPKRMATWHVRMFFLKGKLENIKQKWNLLNLNMLGLSEIRRFGYSMVFSDWCQILYSGGALHERGVEVILEKRDSRYCQRFLDSIPVLLLNSVESLSILALWGLCTNISSWWCWGRRDWNGYETV